MPLLPLAVTLWIFTKIFGIGAFLFASAICPAVLPARDIRSVQERKKRIRAGGINYRSGDPVPYYHVVFLEPDEEAGCVSPCLSFVCPPRRE